MPNNKSRRRRKGGLSFGSFKMPSKAAMMSHINKAKSKAADLANAAANNSKVQAAHASLMKHVDAVQNHVEKNYDTAKNSSFAKSIGGHMDKVRSGASFLGAAAVEHVSSGVDTVKKNKSIMDAHSALMTHVGKAKAKLGYVGGKSRKRSGKSRKHHSKSRKHRGKSRKRSGKSRKHRGKSRKHRR